MGAFGAIAKGLAKYGDEALDVASDVVKQAPPQPIPVVPTMPTNSCGSTRFGYPDFTGTPREGSGCSDSLDCQLHPPAGHPEYQQCCTEDGTCFT